MASSVETSSGFVVKEGVEPEHPIGGLEAGDPVALGGELCSEDAGEVQEPEGRLACTLEYDI